MEARLVVDVVRAKLLAGLLLDLIIGDDMSVRTCPSNLFCILLNAEWFTSDCQGVLQRMRGSYLCRFLISHLGWHVVVRGFQFLQQLLVGIVITIERVTNPNDCDCTVLVWVVPPEICRKLLKFLELTDDAVLGEVRLHIDPVEFEDIFEEFSGVFSVFLGAGVNHTLGELHIELCTG